MRAQTICGVTTKAASILRQIFIVAARVSACCTDRRKENKLKYQEPNLTTGEPLSPYFRRSTDAPCGTKACVLCRLERLITSLSPLAGVRYQVIGADEAALLLMRGE